METRSQDEYTQAHAQFMPTGLAWPRKRTSVLMRLVRGLSAAAPRVESLLNTIARELDSRSASILLGDWETFTGLPDECTTAEATVFERRAAVTSKLVSTGGASAAYFISIAAAMERPGATVEEFAVRRFGSRLGTRYYGIQWRHVWQMNIPGNGYVPRRFSDRFGGLFTHSSNGSLECRVLKLKPAHTTVIFNYEV